ncbi:WcaF family extracellular polysaccharide biosynthesis acetyltransferase [Robertkochia solimangrovi]|uniref:WcaF family extracellular polysaccharide biosynthesis acetyltransferase n=1 Tax=Robertkochia solimangrovi TaxID=2213046 RepID=UPI00117ED113|nr:WcaF family extracellular polysaccharide biosynthesis acetyltransferase [Robertkochia solimangrovi]TRZ44999.1 colanic acid biosynthesis acetyltransferase WcaF [Robertkochia solimangrovi]
MKVELSKFDNSWYIPGGGFIKRGIWYFVNHCVFRTPIPFPSALKCMILRWFGGEIGKEVVLKPRINIKYPWRLFIGDHSWIGEGVWIDNLDDVTIGANVCVSQDAYLLCGNHDFKKEAFDLITKPIVLEDGSWIGARSIVCPGVKTGTNSVLTVGSVASHDLFPFGIYRGNPATFIKERKFES